MNGFVKRYIAGCIAKARADALEDAAKACEAFAESVKTPSAHSAGAMYGAESCASAIRLLPGNAVKLKETGT